MIETAKTLEEAIREFDRASLTEILERGEQQRQEILARFPIERWPEMTLEQYAVGQENSEDTFCRWMEFASLDLGSIKGGSAVKLIIYKHKNKPGWHFPSGFDNEQDAWQQLRHDFVQAFDYAKSGQWAEIDGLPLLAGGAALRAKTMYVYFPEEILPVYANRHIGHFLGLLKAEGNDAGRETVIQNNRRLLAALRELPELSGWNGLEMMWLLYNWSHPREVRRIVKIAPGHQAKYWDDCLEQGHIRVGWDAIGDLNDFESKEALREEIAAKGLYKGHSPTIKRKASELWTLKELEPGDLVVANRGTSQVLAVGEVVEPGYVWRPERDDYRHTVAVEWDTRYEKEIPTQKDWATVTVKKVPPDLFELIASGTRDTGPKPATAEPVDPLYLQIGSALERKGQALLYGPPGTGKTYSARRFAVWWLLRRSGVAAADRVLSDSALMASREKQLSTAQVARRVWWVVTNPKHWSWEKLPHEGRVTFSQGRLGKNYPLVQPGDLVVGYQATPDKKIVAIARISRALEAHDGAEPTIEIEPVSSVNNGLTYEELLTDSMLAKSEPMRSRCQGTLFALTSAEADHLLALLTERDPALQIEDAGYGGEVGLLTRVTFHPSYTYEDFIEGFRPTGSDDGTLSLRLEDGIFKRVCRAAQAHPDRTYLLLIDEINRGNVAKILGELLTLLEQDKRGLTVALPQSKETFFVPKNVYLLGTMNTADRSIKLLDAALRRRFAFIELMPDIELLRGAAVGDLALDDFLEQLNQRIAASEGREKQIGHAYLLDRGSPVSDVEAFAQCFLEEILPLLQEYCYDEYATLANFIGTSLVDANGRALVSERLEDPEQLVSALATEFSSKVETE